MAKLRMGILDGFQGRVGPVVGYRLGSKWIMRRLPQQVCNPRTERQVAHRMMFRDIVRLASALLPALKVGYRAQAGLWEMTEGNAFVKMNWLRDRMPGFNELRISVGAVPMVGFTRVSMEGGRLEAQWEKNQQLAGAKAGAVGEEPAAGGRQGRRQGAFLRLFGGGAPLPGAGYRRAPRPEGGVAAAGGLHACVGRDGGPHGQDVEQPVPGAVGAWGGGGWREAARGGGQPPK